MKKVYTFVLKNKIMRKICLAFLVIFSFLFTFLQAKAEGPSIYKIMTCNIRITGLPDDAAFPERIWKNRRDVSVNTILSKNPDIFCMQEVIYDSYKYFKEKFKDYTSYGFAGPEMDPFTSGYHFIGKNVIFFRTARFELVGSGCYWLSETPLVAGSSSWGTARARHCNWVRLRDKRTGKEFRILDIHLDHKSDSARRKQIKMVTDECSQYAPQFPQIVCGDFNAGIESAPIKYIRTVEGWKEMLETIYGLKELGFSYHGFKGEDFEKKKNQRIDFMFYRGAMDILDAQYVKDHKGKIYPSDHYFLMANFKIK